MKVHFRRVQAADQDMLVGTLTAYGNNKKYSVVRLDCESSSLYAMNKRDDKDISSGWVTAHLQLAGTSSTSTAYASDITESDYLIGFVCVLMVTWLYADSTSGTETEVSKSTYVFAMPTKDAMEESGLEDCHSTHAFVGFKASDDDNAHAFWRVKPGTYETSGSDLLIAGCYLDARGYQDISWVGDGEVDGMEGYEQTYLSNYTLPFNSLYSVYWPERKQWPEWNWNYADVPGPLYKTSTLLYQPSQIPSAKSGYANFDGWYYVYKNAKTGKAYGTAIGYTTSMTTYKTLYAHFTPRIKVNGEYANDVRLLDSDGNELAFERIVGPDGAGLWLKGEMYASDLTS